MVNSNYEARVFAHLRRWVPRRPYATNSLRHGIWQQPKSSALRSRYIQLNHKMIWCLIFDCDHAGTYSAADDGLLARPNLVVLNPKNGRGHLTYFLNQPVASTDAARVRPLQYLAHIQRGMCLRLDADPDYVGLITKNPLHSYWRVSVLSGQNYTLAELDDDLHSANCILPPAQSISGYGRNCTVFDDLRHMAYAKVREFKRNGATAAQFAEWARNRANSINAQFAAPLPFSETRAIARSVSKWVWSRFDNETFRRIQSSRGQRGNEVRWSNHESLESLKPWEGMGISRATYFRRKKRGAS